MPWEIDPFASLKGFTNMFVHKFVQPIPVPIPKPLPSQVDPLGSLKRQLAGGSFAYQVAAQRLRIEKPWCESLQRDRSLNRWHLMLRINPLAFDVGVKLLSNAIKLCCDRVELQSIADCMATKSDSTINKRSIGMMKYVAYCKENYRR